MATFQDVLNSNKEYITLIARKEALKQKEQKNKKIDTISQEIQQAHDEKQTDNFSNEEQDGDLYQIFKNPYTDQHNINNNYDENESGEYEDDIRYGQFELLEYDTSHNVDKQKYAAFKKANGVTYGTHNRADRQREMKIKQLKRLPNRPDNFCISNIWTPSEQQTFLRIAKACSFDPKIIATFLPHKTESLVRRHLVWCRKNDFLSLVGQTTAEIPFKKPQQQHNINQQQEQAQENQQPDAYDQLQDKSDEQITKQAIQNVKAILHPKNQINKLQNQASYLQNLSQSGFIINTNNKDIDNIQGEQSNDEESEILHELDCFI